MLKGVKKLPINLDYIDYIGILTKCNNLSTKLGELNIALKNSIISDKFIRLMSYNESVQSTKIEGTQVTFTEIMEVKENSKVSLEQKEILNYKKAIDFGKDCIILGGEPISSRLIKKLHLILMEGARGTNSNSGEFRKIQNFIGSDKNIKNAVYIPIDANKISEYMTNLEYFINGENHSSFNDDIVDGKYTLDYNVLPILKIAISHAQFESIHPFLDGNGRLGRILIVLMALKYGIVSEALFFVSEELEKEKVKYYNLLNKTRGNNPEWSGWLNFFLDASFTMVEKLLMKIYEVEKYYSEKSKLCQTHAQREILMWCIYDPITSVSKISKLTDLHQSTIRNSLNYLYSIGIIEKDFSKKRNLKYFNYDIIKIISK